MLDTIPSRKESEVNMAKHKKTVKNGIEIVNGWPNPASLTKEKLVDIVVRLQGILWADEDGKPDPDQEWDSACDMIEHVESVVAGAGMKPESPEG